jgi:ABC-type transport system involved in multi-copper enzyme maturation permease subunit
MLTLLGAELLKLKTMRWPWILAGVTLAVTVVQALQPVYKAGREGNPSIGTSLAELAVLDAAGRGALAALLMGVLVVTSEFRHHTVTVSLLQSPQRGRVVTAKAVTAGLVGLGLGVAALMIVLLLGAASGAVQSQLVNSDIALRAVGLVLTYLVYALLGTATGCLLARNQPLAVAIPVLLLAGLEEFALSPVPQGLRVWSILGTTAALQNAGDVPLVLPIWAGGAALLGYSLILLGAGALRVVRADIS